MIHWSNLFLFIMPQTHICIATMQEQSEYKAMNLDQWSAFLRFCDEVWICRFLGHSFIQNRSLFNCLDLTLFLSACSPCLQIKPDLSNYDESQAWPLLLDNYVEWARKCMLTMSWSWLHSWAEASRWLYVWEDLKRTWGRSDLCSEKMRLFLAMFTAFNVDTAVFNWHLISLKRAYKQEKAWILYGSTGWIVVTCYVRWSRSVCHSWCREFDVVVM